MKKNILAITALSALTGTSVLFISLHGGGLLKEFKLSADNMGDYSLVFDKNNNLLDSASSSSSVSLGG